MEESTGPLLLTCLGRPLHLFCRDDYVLAAAGGLIR